jgi:hypothetical protein
MNTKLSTKLNWLEPYILATKHYLPRGKLIARVAWMSVGNKTVGKGNVAAITTYDDKTHTIWLKTQLHPRDSEVTPMSKIDILANLAHELAHTVDWDHTPKHKLLEVKILKRFMELLASTGYVSEEEELKSIT